jgi:hypothetical protein
MKDQRKIINENKLNDSECIPKDGWALTRLPLSQFIYYKKQE